jgi:hypothetical protein
MCAAIKFGRGSPRRLTECSGRLRIGSQARWRRGSILAFCHTRAKLSGCRKTRVTGRSSMPACAPAIRGRLEIVEHLHDARGHPLRAPAAQLGEQRQTDRVGPPLRIAHELQVQLGRPGVAVDPAHDALHTIERGAVQGLLEVGGFASTT